MTTHLIKIPQVLYREIINAMARGESVTIHGLGTIYATSYRKKNGHPSLIANTGEEREYSQKPKKLTRINFRPSLELKEELKKS